MIRLFLPLGEWFASLTWRIGSAVVRLLFVPCSIYSFYAHGGSCGVYHCIVLGVTMVDDIIYRGRSPIGNLDNQKPSWGRYHHFSCMTNDPTSPVGREPMIHMSHRATYYSCTRSLVYRLSFSLLLPVCFCVQSITRVLVGSRILVISLVFVVLCPLRCDCC